MAEEVRVLRVLSYNICRGGSGREAELVSVISSVRPDIVVLQEASDPGVVERVAAGCGLPHWGARPRESLGFMSRLPVARTEWHRPRVSRHAFLEIVPEGLPVHIFGVHLSAVHAAWTERRRMFELRALLASISRRGPGFHVLTGDFNTLAPGELLDFRKLPNRLRTLVWLSGGRIRWRTIQIVLDAGYSDGFRTRHPSDPGLTFPTWDPHVRLDYAFLPGMFVDRLKRCEVIAHAKAQEASDHLPLVSEIETS